MCNTKKAEPLSNEDATRLKQCSNLWQESSSTSYFTNFGP